MRKIAATVVSLVFLIIGLITLPHYGINWDTINHLPRGQSYLNFLLTGHQDYSNKPPFFNGWQTAHEWYWQDPDSLWVKTDIPKTQVPSRSMYEIDGLDFKYYLQTDGDGHPPVSDILSAGFNQILFQKLKLINDIDSYHVYGIVLAAALIGLLCWWTAKCFGLFAGLIASFSLALYPLFWSESHFNTEKDIPEAAYWSFMLFAVYQGVHKKSIRWLLVSGLFFGLALGTKFNIVFSAGVLGPWLLYLYLITHKTSWKNLKILILKYWRLFIAGLTAVLLGVGIFVVSWPYLWMNLTTGVFRMLRFYKVIGTTNSFDPRYLGPFGINTYPVKWILFTTPLVILAFSLCGVMYSLLRIKSKKDDFVILVLLWLAVPIARVTVPGSNIYGGVRQIMEYIPALAILSGIGAEFVRIKLLTIFDRFKKIPRQVYTPLAALIILLSFVPILLKLIQLHPNENAYFNPLIGGLAGAKAKNIPSWGNTFGAGYRQAVSWLNKHAEPGANVVFAYELIPNIPRILLRADLNLHNKNRSGYLRKGEYAITLVYQGIETRSYYDMYLNTFIKPVYEATVDGVAVVRVWKNDDAHLIGSVEEGVIDNPQFIKTDFGVKFDLGKSYRISRLEVNYNQNNCQKLSSGYSETSLNDKDWQRMPGLLPDDWRISLLGEQPAEGHFIEPFVGQDARFVEFAFTPKDACIFNITSSKLYYFKK